MNKDLLYDRITGILVLPMFPLVMWWNRPTTVKQTWTDWKTVFWEA